MWKSLAFLLGTAIVAAVMARPAAQPAARPDMHPVPAHATAAPRAPRPAPPASAKATAGKRASSEKALIEQYCLECHDADKAKGNLVREGYDPAKADERADVSEKIVSRKPLGSLISKARLFPSVS